MAAISSVPTQDTLLRRAGHRKGFRREVLRFLER
jgi:hypothetical protein